MQSDTRLRLIDSGLIRAGHVRDYMIALEGGTPIRIPEGVPILRMDWPTRRLVERELYEVRERNLREAITEAVWS